MKPLHRSMSRRTLIRLASVASVAPFAARAAENAVQIYAAATFRTVLEKVLSAYRANGYTASAVYAPTPVLVEQMEAGAPADIFLSADPGWMDEAVRRGLVRAQTRVDLMGNTLVLVGPRSDTAPREIDNAAPILALVARGRIAMCDPDGDPAGRYAKASLQSLGAWPAVQASLAIAENSLRAVLLVDRGEAAAAMTFATDVQGAQNASILGTFPDSTHPPIVYPVAVTTRTEGGAAETLMTFLRSPEASRILQSSSYRPLPTAR